MDRQEPKYKVRTAARMTGLAPATLRAWENRYGIPRPARTDTRYRLYSEADIAQIRWMKARVDEGVSPHEAAQLARNRPPSAEPVVPEPSLPAPGPSVRAADAPANPDLAGRLKAACLAFDENGARAIVREAASILPPARIMREVVLPAVADMGRGWELGRVTVAQEHFASQYARSFADRLLDVYPQPEDLPAIVLACAPGELHELGLLTLAVELRSRSVPVIYLGQDVPVRDVLDTVESSGAAGAVVAITNRNHIEPWVRAGDRLRRVIARRGAGILWAGPGAFAASISNLPGRVARTFDEAVEACLGFVRAPTSASLSQPTSTEPADA